MRVLRDDPDLSIRESLWAEAMWGLGLIGAVLAFVIILVTAFGL